MRHGSDIGSVFAANNAIQAICAALYARDDTDPDNPTGGQQVEVSLFGSLIAIAFHALGRALQSRRNGGASTSTATSSRPTTAISAATLPIYFSLARNPRRGFGIADRRTRHGLGRASIPTSRKLRTDGAGGAGRYSAELKPLWERGFANFDADQVMEIVERHGGWAFPMHDYERLSKDPQVEAVGAIIEVEQSDGSTMRQIAPPWKLRRHAGVDDDATSAGSRRASS